MYTLRIIEEIRLNTDEPFGQVIENFELGSSYSILTRGNTKEFDSEMKEYHPNERTDTNIRALLCAENGRHYFIEIESPLKRYDYFIMSESGKTFEKL